MDKVPVELDCLACDWSADYSDPPGEQYKQMLVHLDLFHDTRRNPMAPTIIQQMWHELDKHTAEAIEWSGPSKDKPSPDDLNAWCSYLEDMVDKTAKTSAGRGLAIAIMIACTPFFENSDQVVKLAVQRYKAMKAGTEVPSTPGFMGQASGDALHVAAKQNAPTSGTTAKKPAKSAVPSTPPAVGPTQNSATPVIDAGMVAAVKGVAAAGFGVKQIAGSLNLTETQVELCLKQEA
ncbi:hypothetical protein GMA3_78 [Gordonia phage GMA3]|uniref:Uncharacterized protein n=1 Tax=Gordonia phage GMA3 TaxID=1647284 RepID=A0A0K0NKM2_9CAUD|nr:hypothetical protein AU105_gp078 [Gordonia phage GMA3]AKL88255.1 hypothetical protein GMA3_78 [Gordonia phage GMA3]